MDDFDYSEDDGELSVKKRKVAEKRKELPRISKEELQRAAEELSGELKDMVRNHFGNVIFLLADCRAQEK